MKQGLRMMVAAGFLLTSAGSVFASFKDLRSVDSFLDKGNWELYTSGQAPTEVDFTANHTLPEDKAILLGNKKYRFWSVAKHPTLKDQYVLRVHSKKTAGWYSFTWNESKKAWISKNWPQVSIVQK